MNFQPWFESPLPNAHCWIVVPSSVDPLVRSRTSPLVLLTIL